MKLSIVIPVYNQVKYINQCISSIINQGIEDYELIIVDDGSSDNILGELFFNYQKFPFTKIIKHKKNQGLPSALNTGIINAEGEYISWISADNYYGENALHNMIQVLDSEHDVGLVCGNFNIFGLREERWTTNKKIITYEDMKQDNYVRACFMYLKEIHYFKKLYDVNLPCVEDWDFWIRCSQMYKVKHIDNALVYWRDHSENLSNSFCKIHGVEYVKKMKEKYK
jgi:glycosyltransferase involved in cell wall biosynthesis